MSAWLGWNGLIDDALLDWPLAPVVSRLQALRGVGLIATVTFMVEVGHVRRFGIPRRLMAYLGLVPSERSTGGNVRQGGITKAGNTRVRRLLAESSWTYRAGFGGPSDAPESAAV